MVALGVKPAYEDVDVGSFLAFLLTLVEDRIVPNCLIRHPDCVAGGKARKREWSDLRTLRAAVTLYYG